MQSRLSCRCASIETKVMEICLQFNDEIFVRDALIIVEILVFSKFVFIQKVNILRSSFITQVVWNDDGPFFNWFGYCVLGLCGMSVTAAYLSGKKILCFNS